MATKTLTVTEDAYKRLARLKRKNESFSVVIERLTGKKETKLMDYFGILSEEAGENLEKNITATRKKKKNARAKRMNRLRGELL